MARAIKRLPLDCVYAVIDSPVGALTVVVKGEELHAILWQSDMANKQTYELFSKLKLVTQNNYVDRVKQQLGEYFSGQRNKFDLNVVFNGTEFQQQVWRTLLDIPYGSTASYEEQAIRIGGKEKVRAVGTANGANPISIVVPCHRVIGKNGSLTGFAGGLSTKGFLLDLENKSSSSKALE